MSIFSSAVSESGGQAVPEAPPILASVLVIDDVDIDRWTLQWLLKSEGYDVVTAASGDEAIELIRHRQFEVAIADLLMPGKDGRHAIAALKHIDPDIEVIILTGYATVDSTVAALRGGASDYLLKPVAKDLLLPALSRTLAQRRAKAALPLYESSRTLLAELDRGDLFPSILELAEQTMRANGAALALVLGEGDRPIFKMSRNPGPLTEASVLCLTQRTCEARIPLRDSSLPLDQNVPVMPAGSILAYPLRVRNVMLGALVLWRDSGAPRFTGFDVERGKVLVDEISMAVDNARLYRQLTHKIEEVETAKGAAAQAEARARAVIETAREAIVLFDREGVIRDFNPVAEEVFGLTRKQALGKNLADFAIPPSLAEVFKSHLETAYREGRDPLHGSMEVLALRQNGQEFPFEISTAAIETPQGRFLSTFGRDVSERRRAERAVQESESKLKAIFDGVKTGILVIDPETHRIVDANPLALELVGAPRELVVGAVCHKFICPADCGRCPVTDLRQVVDESERILLTANGDKRSIIKTVRPVVIGGRKFLLESFIDITARKRAEKALAEAEEHFRSLFSSIPLPTFFFDAETLQYLEVNDCTVLNTGYSRDEFLKMRVTDLLPPDYTEHVVSRIQALPSHSRQRSEGTYRLKGGRLIDVEVDVYALDFRGRRSVLAVAQDITARKRAEAEMAERHRLATLVADIGVALTRAENLRQGLQRCMEILVSSIGVAFARVWTVTDQEDFLDLQASAGVYTHLEGGHSRVPMGKYKIGRIAESGLAYLTNSVQEDSWVGDPEWARREGMVAFAGYPLKVGDRVLGVLAAFARQPLTATTLQAFASVADNVVQFIKRQRAEEALHESEDRYRDLVENNFLLIGTHDARGNVLNLNRAAARFLEAANAEEVAGRSLADYVPPELLPQFGQYLETVLREGHAEGLMVILTPGGKRKIIEYRNTVRRQGDKAAIVRWAGQDVTERMQAEEKLLRTQFCIEHAADAVTWLDIQGRIVYVNKATCDSLGRSREELLASALSDINPDLPPGAWSREWARIKTAGSATFEARHITKQGKAFPVEVSANYQMIDGKEYLFTFARDITERKEVEQRMHLQTTALEAAANGIVITDQKGQIQWFNPAFSRLTGYSYSELIGKNPRALKSGVHDAEFYRTLWDSIKSGKVWRGELVNRRKGGALYTEETTITPVRDSAEAISHFIAIKQDVTERQRAQEELLFKTALLEAEAECTIDGILVVNRAGQVLQANKRFIEMMDMPPDIVASNEDSKMLEHVLAKVKDPATFLETVKYYYAHESEKAQDEMELKDGKVFDRYSVSLHSPEGKYYGRVWYFRDITERKRSEEALRESELRIRRLTESDIVGLFVGNDRGGIVEANSALLQMLGFDEHELRAGSLHWSRLTPREDQSVNERIRHQLSTTGVSSPVESEFIRRDGSRVPVMLGLVALDASATRALGIVLDLTDRQQAERALEERTVYLNTLFEISPMGIVVLDTEGRIQMSNSAFERLFLYSRQEIAGAKLDEFIVPEALIAEAKSLTGLCLSGPGASLTSSRRRKDGTMVDVDIHGVPLYIEGELRGVLTLYQDITERKRAEADLVRYAEDLEVSKAAKEEHAEELARLVEELERERDLLGTVMDNIPDGLYYKDRQCRILRVNPVAAEIYGLSDPREAVGKTDFDFFPEPDARSYFADEQKVIQMGEALIGHIERVRQPDGHYRWHSTSTVPVRDAQSRVTGLVGITRDMTERLQAEERLKASEERYRELFENASDIVYTTGVDTRLTSLNQVGQQFLGYTAAEAVQLDLLQLVAPKHWEIVRRGRERLLAGESDLTMEVEVTRKDGRTAMLEVKPRVIYKSGNPVGVQGIARDITGRDEAELELRHAQKLESVGRLAAGIAHEINTPIQFVGDNTRFLQDSFGGLGSLLAKYRELRDAAEPGAVRAELVAGVRKLEEEADCEYLLEEIPKALSQTLDGVTRVATIVRAMKEFAHPESKEMAAADINQALQSTLTVARNELKYVSDVETDFCDLPPVVCNVGDLNQVFLNLLVNAAHAIAEATKGQGGRGTIQVRTRSEENSVLISIRDTGAGIPEAIRGRIFDPFFTTKEVGRGTGQGLAIARAVVVDRHKGALTFESEVGKGTTFYIRLPLDPASPQEANVS